jgi:hypothetical protein
LLPDAGVVFSISSCHERHYEIAAEEQNCYQNCCDAVMLLACNIFCLFVTAPCRQLTGTEGLLEEMRQNMKIRDDALKSSAIAFNASENAKKTLENKVKHLEEQVTFLESSLVSYFWEGLCHICWHYFLTWVCKTISVHFTLPKYVLPLLHTMGVLKGQNTVLRTCSNVSFLSFRADCFCVTMPVCLHLWEINNTKKTCFQKLELIVLMSYMAISGT